MHEEITLTREVTAIQIPSGDSVTLPLGTPVYITQRLGGTFTVATSQGLARIPASDADALGIDLEAESRKREAAIRISDATRCGRSSRASMTRKFQWTLSISV